ncbi:MAG: Glutamine amidotransferase subunit PdxT [Armatimonadota bacterium]|jgi:5'-phosphate synthase pdxT subunit
MPKTIGVLALQGGYAAHASVLRRLGANVIEVRLPEQLALCDALVMPGGESTTIIRLLQRNHLDSAIIDRAKAGMPIFATCAGLILLSKRIEKGAERGGQPTLGLLDVAVIRNGFGRQLDSFETDLLIKGLDTPLRSIFIRAPIITDVGPDVDVLTTVDDKIVMVKQGKILAAAFHPELLDDDRVHAYFLDVVVGD